jgi:hypothetical protein
MMKKLLSFFFAISLTLSACGTASTQPTPPAQTGTPTIIPTPTQTPTATITPLPTIPTFTPTFDVSTILTVTPAEKAECPMEKVAPQVMFAAEVPGLPYVNHKNIFDILDYLNSGGKLDELNTELSKTSSLFAIKDVTNDGTDDLVVVSGLAFQMVNIFWCKDGTYSLFPKDIIEADTLGSDGVIFEFHDLNQNGISEILSIGKGRAWVNVNILEWNGETFIDLTSSEKISNANMIGAGRENIKLNDFDKNGILEMTLEGLPNRWYYPGEPLRIQIDTYYWNGNFFFPSTTFGNPQYRFQAIQDGDLETINGNFEQAKTFYEMAVGSKELDWWSQERFEHNRTVAISGTPAPEPLENPAEYPSLAVYAYYRILLLHLVQGQEAEAVSTYQTLQDTFSTDQYAAPYVEMATAFWEAYQSTQKMYDGCAAAIQYAVEHPEILVPLGSDYHGWQSHIYEPADVCPFR